MATNRMMQLRRSKIENTTVIFDLIVLIEFGWSWIQLTAKEKLIDHSGRRHDKKKRSDSHPGWGWSLCWECHFLFSSTNVVSSSFIRNELASMQLSSFDLFFKCWQLSIHQRQVREQWRTRSSHLIEFRAERTFYLALIRPWWSDSLSQEVQERRHLMFIFSVKVWTESSYHLNDCRSHFHRPFVELNIPRQL